MYVAPVQQSFREGAATYSLTFTTNSSVIPPSTSMRVVLEEFFTWVYLRGDLIRAWWAPYADIFMISWLAYYGQYSINAVIAEQATNSWIRLPAILASHVGKHGFILVGY